MNISSFSLVQYVGTFLITLLIAYCHDDLKIIKKSGNVNGSFVMLKLSLKRVLFTVPNVWRIS